MAGTWAAQKVHTIGGKRAQKKGEQAVYLLAGRRLPTMVGNGYMYTIPDPSEL